MKNLFLLTILLFSTLLFSCNVTELVDSLETSPATEAMTRSISDASQPAPLSPLVMEVVETIDLPPDTLSVLDDGFIGIQPMSHAEDAPRWPEARIHPVLHKNLTALFNNGLTVNIINKHYNVKTYLQPANKGNGVIMSTTTPSAQYSSPDLTIRPTTIQGQYNIYLNHSTFSGTSAIINVWDSKTKTWNPKHEAKPLSTGNSYKIEYLYPSIKGQVSIIDLTTNYHWAYNGNGKNVVTTAKPPYTQIIEQELNIQAPGTWKLVDLRYKNIQDAYVYDSEEIVLKGSYKNERTTVFPANVSVTATSYLENYHTEAPTGIIWSMQDYSNLRFKGLQYRNGALVQPTSSDPTDKIYHNHARHTINLSQVVPVNVPARTSIEITLKHRKQYILRCDYEIDVQSTTNSSKKITLDGIWGGDILVDQTPVPEFKLTNLDTGDVTIMSLPQAQAMNFVGQF